MPLDPETGYLQGSFRSTVREMTAMAAMLRQKCTCLWKNVNSASSAISAATRCNCISSTTRNTSFFSHVKCANCVQLSARTLELRARTLHHSSATGRCRMRESLPALSSQRLTNASHSLVKTALLDTSLLAPYKCRHSSSVSLLSKHLPTPSLFGFALKVKNASRLDHARLLSSMSSSGGGGEKSSGNGDGEEGGSAEEQAEAAADDDVSQSEPMNPLMGALSTMNVPEIFPKVPVIAVGRNPVFPRFVKMLEVQQ